MDRLINFPNNHPWMFCIIWTWLYFQLNSLFGVENGWLSDLYNNHLDNKETLLLIIFFSGYIGKKSKPNDKPEVHQEDSA